MSHKHMKRLIFLTAVFIFIIMPFSRASAADLTIGIIADAHAGQKNGFSKIKKIASKIKKNKPDIVINLGDFTENRRDYKQITLKNARADFKKASKLFKSFNTYHVIGNHEMLSLTKANWQNLTGMEPYYSVNIKGYNIIVLDVNHTSGEESIDRNYYDISNKKKLVAYTGTLPLNQLTWLENQLYINEKNIILLHHPMRNLSNSTEIEEIIHSNKDRVVFIANGHSHPKTLQSSIFGEAVNYDIPSGKWQKSYAVAKISGKTVEMAAKKY